MKSLIIVLIMVLTVGCTASIQQLRTMPPDDQFKVSANYLCLYNKAVERASSYMWRGQFHWHMDHSTKCGWIKHAFALVEIIYIDKNSSLVKWHQTGAGQIFKETADIVDFLKNNPCR